MTVPKELLALIEANPTGRLIVDLKDGRVMGFRFEPRKPTNLLAQTRSSYPSSAI